ncbi:MAG: EamA family transporter, partial [Bacteroidota bacterium]
LTSSCGFLTIVLLVMWATNLDIGTFWPASATDWTYLIVLSLLCTTLAYNLAMRALRHISAFASNLAINMEPVYGIVLAWLLLGEQKEMQAGFYWGVAIIILAVFSYPSIQRRWQAEG